MGREPLAEVEKKMVLKAPLAFELQAAGDAMVKLIKKAPPELQPVALAAALTTVAEFQAVADAAVEQLPDYPESLSVERIRVEANAMKAFYSSLPPGSSAQVFFAGLGLLSDVEEMVSPLSSDAPTLPHQLSTRLINNQAEMLIKYITREYLT